MACRCCLASGVPIASGRENGMFPLPCDERSNDTAVLALQKQQQPHRVGSADVEVDADASTRGAEPEPTDQPGQRLVQKRQSNQVPVSWRGIDLGKG